MSIYGRSYPPLRQIINRAAPPAVSATVNLGSVAVVLGVPAPAVTANGGQTVHMPVVATSFAVPAMTVHAQLNTVIVMPSVAVVLATKDLTVSVPILPGAKITGPGQIEYNGVVWGADDIYRVVDLSGWDDLPGVDSGNVPRSSRHGAYPGRKLAQERDVSAVIWMRDDSTTFGISLDAILAATPIAEDETELPLVIRTRGEPRLAYGMVVARVSPPDNYGVGTAKVTVRWVCSDPRRYGLTARGLTVPANSAGPTNCANIGNSSAHPIVRITGPAVNPVLINETLDRTLGFNITITAGQRLDIDTDAGTVAIGNTSKMSTLSGSSVAVQDWVLGAGVNNISFDTTTGGTAGADILWRDSYL